MITTIKASNVDAFNLLFEEATNILSGYKEVRTYSPNTQYYYKKSGANKGYVPFEFSIEEGADSELVQFANALAEGCKMYIKVKDEPVGGFSPELGITTLEEYYNWLPDLKSVTVEAGTSNLPLRVESADIKARAILPTPITENFLFISISVSIFLFIISHRFRIFNDF